jgi:hypothetical protein
VLADGFFTAADQQHYEQHVNQRKASQRQTGEPMEPRFLRNNFVTGV